MKWGKLVLNLGYLLAWALFIALTLLAVLFFSFRKVFAAPQDAVVRIPSHGGSGTVIWSVPGKTLILSCGHAFEGSDRQKPIVLDAPSPSPGAIVHPGIRLVAVDYRMDLSLIEMRTGPLPYVAPVAIAGYQPGRCISVGYDEMKLPPTVRRATILGTQGMTTYTREIPWHGRSGGALMDQDRGVVVGVVQGYEVDGARRGMYVSHATITRFLWPQKSSAQAPYVTEERVPYCPPGLCPGGT